MSQCILHVVGADLLGKVNWSSTSAGSTELPIETWKYGVKRLKRLFFFIISLKYGLAQEFTGSNQEMNVRESMPGRLAKFFLSCLL